MGNIFRKRRPPTEELDEIVGYLKDLEVHLKEHLESRSSYLRLLLYTIFFIFSVTSAYFWLHYHDLKRRTLTLGMTLVCSIFLFFTLRAALLSIYDYLINSKRKKIEYYTERKLAIIEDVKENEKFKVAKEIIEKYSTSEEVEAMLKATAPKKADALRADKSAKKGEEESSNSNANASNNTNIPRRSTISSMSDLNTSPTETPKVPKLHEISNTRFRRPPIRPFVEQTQNPLDRILDYIMGESISNRYALICVQCHAHNGMALKEEFEQIAFFCFKCNAYNASRNELKASKQIHPMHTRTSPIEESETDDDESNQTELTNAQK
ncbi:putative integral membrane zinc-ribbon metal-binding protein domain-containing protein [Ditylenchus destructor]|uniref:Endoplasmic reticulum junction formation protein lunapark n=1 Tax=Ditylenchus destructor TaxID=166010 RepID=A0AAD4NHI7_9BILA|nr:putative integral membrane zinc-ribbon metal-binding protein domain-containing protein [Ditylenchus destructor]